MSTTVDGREIFPVKDDEIPDLLAKLRDPQVAKPLVWMAYAADTIEAFWLHKRDWHRAIEMDIAEEKAKGRSTWNDGDEPAS